MAKKKVTAKDEQLEVVFLDEVLGALEARLGEDISLAAFDPDDLDDLLYGFEMLEASQEAGERDPADLVPEDEVGLTEEELGLLRAAEAEYEIRLVVYHWGADMILYGGDVLDDALAEGAARSGAG
jgi:hypothetical protein